jgi:hypothetical protein
VPFTAQVTGSFVGFWGAIAERVNSTSTVAGLRPFAAPILM